MNNFIQITVHDLQNPFEIESLKIVRKILGDDAELYLTDKGFVKIDLNEK